MKSLMKSHNIKHAQMARALHVHYKTFCKALQKPQVSRKYELAMLFAIQHWPDPDKVANAMLKAYGITL